MTNNLKTLMKAEKAIGATIVDELENCFISCRGKFFKKYVFMSEEEILITDDYEKAASKALIRG